MANSTINHKNKYNSDKENRKRINTIFVVIAGALMCAFLIMGCILISELREDTKAPTHDMERTLSSMQYSRYMNKIIEYVIVNKYNGIPMTGDWACVEGYADYVDASFMHTCCERMGDEKGMSEYEKKMEDAKSRMGGLESLAGTIDEAVGNKDIAAVNETQEY